MSQSRRSSRGNPNHDERGRFCTADNCKIKSERTSEEYEARTKERMSPYKKNDDVTVRTLGGHPLKGRITKIEKDYKGDPCYLVEYTDANGGNKKMLLDENMLDEWNADRKAKKTRDDRKRVSDAHRRAKDEVLFVQKFGDKQLRCHASIVSELPEKTSPWSNGYSRVGAYEKDGETYEVYKDRDDSGQFSYFAVKEKMPWENDPKYKNNKNGKLLWLMDNPQSKYNSIEFLEGIKRIERMADRGASKEARLKAWHNLINSLDMTDAEARHFIAKEFLE